MSFPRPLKEVAPFHPVSPRILSPLICGPPESPPVLSDSTSCSSDVHRPSPFSTAPTSSVTSPCLSPRTFGLEAAAAELISSYEERIAQLESSYTSALLELDQVRDQLHTHMREVVLLRNAHTKPRENVSATADIACDSEHELFDNPSLDPSSLPSVRQALRIVTRKLSTSESKVVSTEAKLSSVEAQLVVSKLSLQETTESLRESESKRTALTERVGCLQSHIKLCADHSARALNVERDLRREIEDRVAELLEELGRGGSSSGSRPSQSTSSINSEDEPFRPFSGRRPRPVSMYAASEAIPIEGFPPSCHARPVSMYGGSLATKNRPSSADSTRLPTRPLGRRATSEQFTSSSGPTIVPYHARQRYLKELKLGKSCDLHSDAIYSRHSPPEPVAEPEPTFVKRTWSQETKRISAILALIVAKKIGNAVLGSRAPTRAAVDTNISYWMDIVYEDYSISRNMLIR